MLGVLYMAIFRLCASTTDGQALKKHLLETIFSACFSLINVYPPNSNLVVVYHITSFFSHTK